LPVAVTFPVHRIYCVGRNYAEHAQEMGFSGREPPFFFMKPADAVVPVPDGETGEIDYPSADGQPAPRDRARGGHRQAAAADIGRRCGGHIWGYAVGLDMTRRDLQNDMKKQGRPWCIGKAFEQSAPIGPIVPIAQHRRLTQPAPSR
jgi:fumarylpyruvate hydrolase